MRHPADPHIEYFAFQAPDGVCVVAMLRGVWVQAQDGLPTTLSCTQLLNVCGALRGDLRRMVDRRSGR